MVKSKKKKAPQSKSLELIAMAVIVIALFAMFVLALGGSSVLTFVSPTPPNATQQNITSVPINVTIASINHLGNFTWQWNNQNYSIFDSTLVAMFDFNNYTLVGDSLTTVADLSVNNQSGTFNNVQWTQTGKYGSAINMTAGSVALGNATANLNDSLTVIAWFNASIDASANHAIVSQEVFHNGTIRLFLYTSSTPKMELAFDFANGNAFNAKILSTMPLNDSLWHQAVATRDNTAKNYSLYVDGVIQSSATYAGTVGTNWSSGLMYPVTIGNNPLGTMPFIGTIDEVSIYNRALTASEVQIQYMSNLQQYNQTTWDFAINQTLNATSGLANGTYTYQAFAMDSTSTLNATAYQTILIGTLNLNDLNAPTVTIVSPFTNQTYSSNTISFNATFTDNVNVSNMTLFIWNSTNALINQTTRATTGNGSVNITVVLPRTDWYTMNYLASDNSSNTARGTNVTFEYVPQSNVAGYGQNAFLSFYRQYLVLPRPNNISVATFSLRNVSLVLQPMELNGAIPDMEFNLTKPSTFASVYNTTLAVNANMFIDITDGSFTAGHAGDTIGTWTRNTTKASDYNESGNNSLNRQGAPIEFVFNASNYPQINSDNRSEWFAPFNGVGARDWFIKNGVRQPCTWDKFASCGTNNARTLYGLTQDNQTMFVVTIDAGGGSSGVTIYEAADIMLSLGAYNAVEMDGGGSTSMIINNGTGQQMMSNVGASERSVAGVFGIVYNAGISQSQGQDTTSSTSRLDSFSSTMLKLVMGFIALLVVGVAVAGVLKNDWEHIRTHDVLQYAILIILALTLATALFSVIGGLL